MIDDEEFCLLYDANRSKKPEFPYEEYGKYDLEEIDNSECKAEFRFWKEDIPMRQVCFAGCRLQVAG